MEEELTRAREQELRAMIWLVARDLGVRAAARVIEAGLDHGHLSETVDVAGVTWELDASFARRTACVAVSGTPQRIVEGGPEIMPGVRLMSMDDVRTIFGEGQGFSFNAPLAWIQGRDIEKVVERLA